MVLRPLLSLLLLAFATAAWAADLPKISSYSKRDGIEIFVGDTLVLEAHIDGKDMKLSWVSQEKVLCNEVKCSILTEGWSLGQRNVVFVAQNSAGTRSLTYKIRVKRRPEGSSPETITPEVVGDESATGGDSMAHNDFFIRARLGLGFAHNKENEARIVNAQPTTLNWDTRFKSSGGVLQFGRVGEEDHVLMPGTFAYLDSFENRRLIVLEDGMLRSRQLKAEAPQWSVVSGDWLQVDGSKDADIVVNVAKHSADAKTPIARVMVLRGQARVLVRKPGAKTVVPKTDLQKIADEETGESTPGTMDDDDGGGAEAAAQEKDAVAKPVTEAGEQEFIVPAGSTFLVNFLDKNDMVLRLAPTALMQRILENSSPKYLDYQGWGALNNKDSEVKVDRHRDVFVLDSEQAPKNVEDAVGRANKLYPSRDYIQMLELLLPFAGKNKAHFELNLLLGQAYRGLRLYEPAYYFFHQAQTSQPKDPELLFQLGMLAVEFQRWEEAQNYLAQADDAGHPQRQMILYYQGYTSLRRGRDYKAREYLHKSLWEEEQNKELADATRESLRKWDRDRLWVAKGRFSTLYDTNVFRKPNSDPAPKNIGQSTGAALTFDLEIAARAFQSDYGNFTFGFDFSYLSWFNHKLKAVDTGYQKIYSAFNFIGGELNDPWMLVDAQIYMTSTIVGGQRTTDGLGLLAGVVFPMVTLEPEIFFDTSYHVDPLPNRNDALDPFLWEVVGASDRSARLRKIGLGATLAQDDSSQWRARLTNTANAHSAKIVSIDDYNENRLDVFYDLQYMHRLEYGAQFHVGARSFASAPDNRKDSFLGAKGSARWYQTPFLSYDGWLSTQFQSSNRSANKFTKFILGAGAQMEL